MTNYWLAKKKIAKSNSPDLFWLIEECNGVVGKQQHSIPITTAIIITEGLVIQSKIAQYLKHQEFLGFGCDTVDIAYDLKVMIMYYRCIVAGEPYNAYFAIRNELGATGAQLMQYLQDVASGNDIIYGYDIKRKARLEACKSNNENNENDNGNSNNNNEMENDISVLSGNQNKNKIKNKIVIKSNGHPYNCICFDCIDLLLEGNDNSNNNNDGANDDSDDDNDDSDESDDIEPPKKRRRLSKYGNKNSNVNDNGNNNDRDEKKEEIDTSCIDKAYAMKILSKFVQIVQTSNLVVGLKKTMLDTVSLNTDGGKNYYGHKNGLRGQV